MEDCEKLKDCPFFGEFKKKTGNDTALKGLVRIYCRGEKRDSCMRKKVGSLLGGTDRVPANMMPNGAAIAGTDYSAWPDVVKRILGGL